MIYRRIGTFCILPWLLLASCTGPDPSLDITAFGLVEAPSGRPEVLAAIAAANTILGPGVQTKLAPAWLTRADPPGSVRVHAVGAQGLSRRELVAVYTECRCVVVKARGIEEWLADKTGAGTGLLTIEPRFLLAYMLMHEVGHVVAKDATRADAGAAAPAGTTPLNRDPTAQKNREIAADRFAAGAIASARDAGSSQGLAAMQVMMALSSLSWNLAAHRLIDDFGGTAVRKRSLFWDDGYSHPNLELRVLTVNALIARTEAAEQLLKDFQGLRDGGPIIWYQQTAP
jgi:hypothetical protein